MEILELKILINILEISMHSKILIYRLIKAKLFL